MKSASTAPITRSTCGPTPRGRSGRASRRRSRTYGWCATIRGVESGGLVDGLPVHNFKTESGDIAMKCPTETPISDRREKELADLGFAPLVHCKGTDYAAFFSVQSAQKPKMYDSDAATANARISAQLPYIFAVSRFAHYLKSIMRDKIGGFASRDEVEAFLNNWIIKYAVANDDVGFAVKASHPLKEARVEVVEVAGQARRVPRRRVPPSALPAGRAVDVDASRRRPAQGGQLIGRIVRRHRGADQRAARDADPAYARRCIRVVLADHDTAAVPSSPSIATHGDTDSWQSTCS